VKLHTKIIIGLLSGATVGVVANGFATGADWVAWTGVPAGWAAPRVQWLGDNIAGPVGQIFLRMLLMTIVPLVFASLTLGSQGSATSARSDVSAADDRLFPGFDRHFSDDRPDPRQLGPTRGRARSRARQELLATYRAQAQGLQAGGGGKFGVDMFVNIVPSNPIKAAASLDMLASSFFPWCSARR